MSRTLGWLSLALLVIAPLGARFHLLPLRIALLLVPAAALLGLIAAGIGAFRLARQPTPEEKSRARLGLVTGLVPVLFMANVFASGRGAPMIHDITTDVQDPPAFVAARTLASREAENSLDYDRANAPLQQKAFADLHSLKTPEDLAHAFEHAKAVALKLGWDIYAQDPQAGRIEAVDTTRLFGFKDDVVIRIRGVADGCLIDLRSVSRVGHGDLGANARRIRKFIAAYTAA